MPKQQPSTLLHKRQNSPGKTSMSCLTSQHGTCKRGTKICGSTRGSRYPQDLFRSSSGRSNWVNKPAEVDDPMEVTTCLKISCQSPPNKVKGTNHSTFRIQFGQCRACHWVFFYSLSQWMVGKLRKYWTPATMKRSFTVPWWQCLDVHSKKCSQVGK